RLRHDAAGRRRQYDDTALAHLPAGLAGRRIRLCLRPRQCPAHCLLPHSLSPGPVDPGEGARMKPSRIGLTAYVALATAFLLAPLLIVAVVSFGAEAILRFPPRGFSLKWYVEAFTYRTFLQAIFNSLLLAVLATAISALLGVPAALAIARGGKATAPIEAFLLS